MQFTNNSCTRITRMYYNFELDIPGNTTVNIPVPNEHAENVTKFLRQYHPAVQMSDDKVVELVVVKTEAVIETAATSHDASIVDINSEEETGREEIRAEIPKEVEPAKVIPVLKPAKKTNTAKRGGKK